MAFGTMNVGLMPENSREASTEVDLGQVLAGLGRAKDFETADGVD
jgi:hypothetical protein